MRYLILHRGISNLLIDLLMTAVVISIGTGAVVYSINLTKDLKMNISKSAGNSVECLSVSAALIHVGSYTYLILNNHGSSVCKCSVINTTSVITTVLLNQSQTTILRINAVIHDAVIICNSTIILKPEIMG